MGDTTEDAYATYDAALDAIRNAGNEPSINQRAMVRRFLLQTPEEDEWLKRDVFINGSLALLLRSMISEVGSAKDRRSLEQLGEVRIALNDFVTGRPVSQHLQHAAEMSIRNWKVVRMSQDEVASEIKRSMER